MASKSILVAEFSHETNTFVPTMTREKDFKEHREYIGEEISRKMSGTNTAIGGVIDAADEEEEEVEIVYAVAASATPGGRISTDTYKYYSRKILNSVEMHKNQIDGIMLCLHGAMVTEDKSDGEGILINQVQEVVNDDIPISVSLDLHGNISDRLVSGSDILVSFESYPHIDMGETGYKAMKMLIQTLKGEIIPVTHAEHPPILSLVPKQNTNEKPMCDVMKKARWHENNNSNILKVNIFTGFHKADVPFMGWTIVVVSDESPKESKLVARDMAKYVWKNRRDFVDNYPHPKEAIARSKYLAAEKDPDEGFILLSDTGDNPGSGGAADGTTVLREMIDQDLQNAGFAIIRDEEAVQKCIETGVGERLEVDIGGKTDNMHGDPIENLDTYVKSITDGEFINTGPMGTGSENHLGKSVLIECGLNNGIKVILTENRLQPLDAEIWRHMGVQPERFDIVVVKSMNHYRADYGPMCSSNIHINSTGLGSMDPRQFEFSSVSGPRFPLDQIKSDSYPNW